MAGLTPEQLLEAAEKVRRASESDDLLRMLKSLPRTYPWQPQRDCHGFEPPRIPECGCATGAICMNVACPHRIQVLC